MMHKLSTARALGCLLSLSLFSHCASAAGLQIGSLDLRPGQSAELVVDFQGDGKIVGYSGYVLADTARLALPPVGTIMPSTAGYICKRISETRIIVISEILGSQPLPANIIDANVDELEPVPAAGTPALDACDMLDRIDDGFMRQTIAGHGTHVAGTAASNATNADGYTGVCRNCGVGM